MRTVGKTITVRRVWRTTLLGTAVGGTAKFNIYVAGQYFNGATLQGTPHDFPMTQNPDGSWSEDYTPNALLLEEEVQEIAIHSVYGSLTKSYTIQPSLVDQFDAEAEPSATFGA